MHSCIVEILDDPSEFSPIRWGRVPNYLLLDEEALPGISRSLGFDHVISATRNCPRPL
jgi:hypothetical protein